MVDTSGSSSSSTSTSEGESNSMGVFANDSSRAFARKKKSKRKTERRQNTDTIDDIHNPTVDDVDNDDDQKLPSSSPCTLGPYDVICGRSKKAFNNIGNRRFRFTIAVALPRFLNAKSRKEKSVVIESIKKLVHQNGGKFLVLFNDDEENTVSDAAGSTVWTELDTKQSHLKVGHALRDAERKLSKAQKQQQKQLRQLKQKQQQTHETQKLNPTFENQSLLNVNVSDTLLLDQSDSWNLDEYDASSMSTISYIDVVDSYIHSKSRSLHPSARSSQSTMIATNEQLDAETTRPHQGYHPTLYSRPMQKSTDITTYSAILDRRQQLQQPLMFSNSKTMVMNDDNSNLPISWMENCHLANDKVPPQPARDNVGKMRSNDHSCHRMATPLTDDPMAMSEQNHHHHYMRHIDDDHHQHIMSWLVDESEDVLDDTNHSLEY